MVERVIAILALLAIASAFAVWWQRRDGRVTRVSDPPGAVSSVRLGSPRGFRATFVQFSTSTCAKCPPTAALLSRIAAAERGVAHVEIDQRFIDRRRDDLLGPRKRGHDSQFQVPPLGAA